MGLTQALGRRTSTQEFTNWSGSVSFTAGTRVEARDAEEVGAAVRDAARRRGRVRPVGSGHSSTPLVATDDVLLSLDGMSGLVGHDTGRGLATVLPGTGLSDLGAQLAEVGLGLENLGDVDYQTIAGAIGTGTHGTGERLRHLSAALVGGVLVDGRGDAVPFGVDAGDDPDDADAGRGSDLLRAAQVSLGSLGVLTSLTLRVRPAYQLRRRNYMTHIDWVLEHFDALAADHRHVDFYWYPRSDHAQVRMLDEPGQDQGLLPPGELRKDVTGPSYEILPNHREIEFEEMEYMLPREVGLTAFRAARDRIKAVHRKHVAWRVLVRTVAADGAMLSNTQHRPTMTLALLQNATLGHEHYFKDMEPLLLDFGGRPHWGKKHTRTAPALRAMYPEWDAFQRLRREMDPDGVLMNDYLRTLLEADRNDDGAEGHR